MLFQMSVYGAVIIMVIFLIRPIIKRLLPKNILLILWAVVFIRLLIPYTLISPISIYSLWDRSFESSAVEISFPLSSSEPDIDIYPDKIPNSEISEDISNNLMFSSNPTEEKNSVLTLIYLSVSVVAALFFTIIYLRCLKEFKISLPIKNDFTEKWLNEHPLRRSVSIRQSDKISSPITYGILRPVVLMPKSTDWSCEKRLNYVFLHEYVHIRRFNALLKLICTIVLCIHWFNPAVWLMYFLFNRDIELSCDEITVKKSGIGEKADYARTLIEMEENKLFLPSFHSAFVRNFLKERIIAVMKIKKTAFPAVISGAVLTFALISVFAFVSPDKFYSEDKAFEISSENTGKSFTNIELPFTENNIKPNDETYAVYEPFGLTINPISGKLYYNEKPVRRFDDKISNGFFGVKAVGYFEKDGVTDIKAVRENNVLIGLEIISDESFGGENNDFYQRENDMPEMFSAYSEYGLNYNKEETAFYYDGNRVRLFWDSLNSFSSPSLSENPFLSKISN